MIMKKYPTRLYRIAEANLILWLTLLGATAMPLLFDADTEPSFANKSVVGITIVGMLFAAVLQHWAYHNIYKPNRKDKVK